MRRSEVVTKNKQKICKILDSKSERRDGHGKLKGGSAKSVKILKRDRHHVLRDGSLVCFVYCNNTILPYKHNKCDLRNSSISTKDLDWRSQMLLYCLIKEKKVTRVQNLMNS